MPFKQFTTVHLTILCVCSAIVVALTFGLSFSHHPTSPETTTAKDRYYATDLSLSSKQVGNHSDLLELFEPGSLSLSRRDSIAKCWTGSPKRDQQKEHNFTIYFSKKYRAVVMRQPKTGSTTQRRVLMQGLGFTLLKKKFNLLKNGNLFFAVATREPLARFISGYKEVLSRYGYIAGDKRNVERGVFDGEAFPAKYSGFLQYLEGMTLREQNQMFHGETIEDLQLKAAMLDTFVEDYESEDLFNNHLDPQTRRLWDIYEHRMKHFDLIMETSNLDEDLGRFAEAINATLPPKVQALHARDRKDLLFDTNFILDRTIQKICRINALDYCCLNYELPEACRKPNIPAGERVKCKWVPTPEEDKTLLEGDDDGKQIGYVLV